MTHTFARLHGWADGNLTVVRHAKTQFITDPICNHHVMSKIHPQYAAIEDCTAMMFQRSKLLVQSIVHRTCSIQYMAECAKKKSDGEARWRIDSLVLLKDLWNCSLNLFSFSCFYTHIINISIFTWFLSHVSFVYYNYEDIVRRETYPESISPYCCSIYCNQPIC